MKYLWIGVSNSPKRREVIVKNGGKLLSAEVSSEAILKGFEENGILCDSINAGKLPTYPRYPEKKIPRSEWTSEKGMACVSVGYTNRPYISILSKKRSLVKEAKAWAIANRDEDVTVFVYQMHSPFMHAAKTVKRIIPSAKIVLIVPDLPQFMDLHMSPFKKILKAIDWKTIRRLMKSVDKYVLYSKHMAKFLGLRDGSWTVMEGSYDTNLLLNDSDTVSKSDKISVMYSGVLDTRYGIPELLDAFAELDDKFELWFTGTGNAVELINKRAENDPRIKNFGFLPSRRDLLLKQREATMLISTRRPTEPASDYCFPSKLFEYMVSGNPVLSCRIGGIPDEYFDYLVDMKSVSKDDIKAAILKIADMELSEREEIGVRSKEFILKEKSNVAQSRRMFEFIGNDR